MEIKDETGVVVLDTVDVLQEEEEEDEDEEGEKVAVPGPMDDERTTGARTPCVENGEPARSIFGEGIEDWRPKTPSTSLHLPAPTTTAAALDSAMARRPESTATFGRSTSSASSRRPISTAPDEERESSPEVLFVGADNQIPAVKRKLKKNNNNAQGKIYYKVIGHGFCSSASRRNEIFNRSCP